MGKDVRSHGLDVIGKDVVTAGDGGEGTSGSEQRKAAARASAEFEGRVFARGLDDADGVATDGGFDVQVPEGVCQARQFLAGDDRLEGIHRVLAFEAAQDLVLLVLAGVAELEPDEETVELGLGKRKGPFETTRNGLGSMVVTPSTVSWCSSMASRSAAWVRGVARLISSASTTWAMSGPSRNTNSPNFWL